MNSRQNTVKLGEIADVRSGYSFRSRLEPEAEGDVKVFLIKGLAQKKVVDPKDAVPVVFPNVKSDILLQRGDILFTARGLHNVAGVVDFDPDRAIASGQLLWMRLISDTVTPAYLTWYLNQQPAQVYLKQRKTGTRVPIITCKTLLEMPLTILPLETQRRFVELDELFRREKKLNKEIWKKRQLLVEQRMLRALEKI